MTEVRLARPRSVEDLYLARHADVSPARPLLTGDVLADVDIGVPHHGYILLAAHPCSMRGVGGALRPRIGAVPVRRYQELPLDSWPSGHFNAFPLPELFDEPHAAQLLELGSAAREALASAHRVASLSDHGIYVLQQRFVHSLTRVVVGLDRLEGSSGHVLAEAELEEEWVEKMADLDDSASVARETGAFQDFLGQEARDDLKLHDRRSGVRRVVRQEIDARRRARA